MHNDRYKHTETQNAIEIRVHFFSRQETTVPSKSRMQNEQTYENTHTWNIKNCRLFFSLEIFVCVNFSVTYVVVIVHYFLCVFMYPLSGMPFRVLTDICFSNFKLFYDVVFLSSFSPLFSLSLFLIVDHRYRSDNFLLIFYYQSHTITYSFVDISVSFLSDQTGLHSEYS